MKRILLVASLYRPHVGGIETMIEELADIYQRQGIEVSVLTKRWPTNLTIEEKYRGVNIYRVSSARTNEQFDEIVNWILKNEDKIKADIIHVIGVRRPLPLIALLCGKRWNVPVICTVAGGEIPDSFDGGPAKIWEEGAHIIPETLKQADHVNCLSDSLTNNLRKALPDLTKATTLYAGMDFSIIRGAIPEKIKSKYIFSLRRLDPSKGIDVLIRAFSEIGDSFPDVELVIAGDGSEMSNLKSIVSDLKLQEKVTFLGTISLKRGISLLKGALFTVVPSLSEGGGLVNIEAQAAGCPVIASRVGGIPEYVKDGYSGLLVNPGSYHELAEKMSLLLTDDKLRNKIINGGFSHSKNFDWDYLAPKYIQMYEDAITGYAHKTFVPWSELTERLWAKLQNNEFN